MYFLIHLRCSHLAMCPAWPPWPPPTPPSSPTPGPRSSPRQRASSSVNFRGLKSVSELMKSFLRYYLFQNFGMTPQHSSIPLRAFSAACMSLLMETRPDSIFSSCSEQFSLNLLHQGTNNNFGGAKIFMYVQRNYFVQ